MPHNVGHSRGVEVVVEWEIPAASLTGPTGDSIKIKLLGAT
jgi:hypothetical protein